VKFLLLLIVASCSFIPKLEKLNHPVPEKLSDVKGPGLELLKDGDGKILRWEEFYQDEKLKTLIRLALENNRDFRGALLAIEESRALYGIERSNYFPTIRVNGSLTQQHFPENAVNQGRVVGAGSATPISAGSSGFDQKLYGLNVGITSYELDFFGRIRSLSKAALLRFLASESASENLKIILVSDLASAYFRFQAHQKLRNIAEDTVKAQEESLQIIQNRYKAGVTNELEWRQAQTLMETTRADMISYERQTALDQNALRLLVGADYEKLNIVDLGELTKTMGKLTINLDSKFLLQRPDIKRAENLLNAANADIGAARAAFFPVVSLTGNVGKLSRETSNLFEEGSNSWSFNPTISLPIFTGGRLKAQLNVSKIRKDQRVVEYESTIQRAFREVSDALISHEKLNDLLKAQERAVEAASVGYRISRQRYRSGLDNYIIELDSRRELYRAQSSHVLQQLEYSTNLTFLYRVIGGGVN
jgi:NodT family efflux transporter outer membrane factor (OMF) lipoprotein